MAFAICRGNVVIFGATLAVVVTDVKAVALGKERHILHAGVQGGVDALVGKFGMAQIRHYATGAAGDKEVKEVVFGLRNGVGRFDDAEALVKVGNMGLEGDTEVADVCKNGHGQIHAVLMTEEETALVGVLSHGDLAPAGHRGNKEVLFCREAAEREGEEGCFGYRYGTKLTACNK